MQYQSLVRACKMTFASRFSLVISLFSSWVLSAFFVFPWGWNLDVHHAFNWSAFFVLAGVWAFSTILIAVAVNELGFKMRSKAKLSDHLLKLEKLEIRDFYFVILHPLPELVDHVGERFDRSKGSGKQKSTEWNELIVFLQSDRFGRQSAKALLQPSEIGRMSYLGSARQDSFEPSSSTSLPGLR